MYEKFLQVLKWAEENGMTVERIDLSTATTNAGFEVVGVTADGYRLMLTFTPVEDCKC